MIYVKGNDLVAKTMISCCDVCQLVCRWQAMLCIYPKGGIFDELSPASKACRQVG